MIEDKQVGRAKRFLAAAKAMMPTYDDAPPELDMRTHDMLLNVDGAGREAAMMKEWRFALAILGLALMFVVFVYLAATSSGEGCRRRWDRSGMQASWGIDEGCRVEVRPGKWIPERAYLESQ